MGSRLHGNDDGRRRAHPRESSDCPRRRESTATISSFPRRRESMAGGRGMGSRLHGNDGGAQGAPTIVGGNPRPHIVIPAKAGIHGGGPGDRFPSPRERRWAAAGAPGRRRESTAPTSSFPRRRESTAGGPQWVPVSTGTTGAPKVIPATAGIHGGHSRAGGRGMGSRLHGNDERRRAHPVGGGAPTSRPARERRWAV